MFTPIKVVKNEPGYLIGLTTKHGQIEIEEASNLMDANYRAAKLTRLYAIAYNRGWRDGYEKDL